MNEAPPSIGTLLRKLLYIQIEELFAVARPERLRSAGVGYSPLAFLNIRERPHDDVRFVRSRLTRRPAIFRWARFRRCARSPTSAGAASARRLEAAPSIYQRRLRERSAPGSLTSRRGGHPEARSTLERNSRNGRQEGRRFESALRCRRRKAAMSRRRRRAWIQTPRAYHRASRPYTVHCSSPSSAPWPSSARCRASRYRHD